MADTKPSTSAGESLYQAVKAAAPAGSKLVSIQYSGEGDSGQLDGIYVDGVYSEKLSRYGSPVESVAEAFMWHGVSGNDEGGGGEIVIDLVNMTITREEYYNVHSKEYLGEEKWQIW